MPSQRLAPDAILVQTNLAGAVTAIDEDPDSPDASWLTAPGSNNATDLRVSFGTPTAGPAGLQEFRVQVRKTNHSTNPSAVVELWENGALVLTVVSTTTITSTTGQILAGTWDSSALGTADGSLVECRVVGTTGGGSPGNRASVEVGAVEWNAVLPYVGTGVFTLPALDGSGAGTVGDAGTTGSGVFTFPALTLSGTAENTRKFEEGFEGPGYENPGWTEDVFSESGGPIGTLDENFLVSSVPGGRPNGWGSQCFKLERLTSKGIRAVSPLLASMPSGYWNFDVVIGSESLPDDNQAQLLAIGASSDYQIVTYIRQVSGNLRFRFDVKTSGSTTANHDWTTNLALSTRYSIEFFRDINTDEYEIWVNGTSVFSGTTTTTQQPNRVYLGGLDLPGGGFVAYIDRIGIDSGARLPAPTAAFPPMTMTATGSVLIQGAGAFNLPAISTFEQLLADSTEWTADSTLLTADMTHWPTTTAQGDVLVGGAGTFELPTFTGFGEGSVSGGAVWDIVNLTAVAVSATQIDLDWDAVAGTVLAFYEIERDGSVIDTSGTNSYSDTGLDPSTLYEYRVRPVQSG